MDKVDFFLLKRSKRSVDVELQSWISGERVQKQSFYSQLKLYLKVRIYKRKQESKKKKKRKHAIDQETDQINDQEIGFFFFFLGRFLGRERVFMTIIIFSVFLSFFFFSSSGYGHFMNKISLFLVSSNLFY